MGVRLVRLACGVLLVAAGVAGCNAIFGFEEGVEGYTSTGGGTGGTGGAMPGGGRPVGDPCTSDGDCQTGYCVHEVCCASRCGDLCHSCADGQCDVVPLGQDPHDDCPGGVCDGEHGCLSGEVLWAKRFGDASAQYALGVATAGGDDILLAGWFRGTIDFGSGVKTSAGGQDVFVARFHPDGTLRWGRAFGGPSNDAAVQAAADRNDDVIVVGQFADAYDFCDTTLTSVGGMDGFVAKSTETQCQWITTFGSSGSDLMAFGLGIHPDNAISVGGSFVGTMDVGTQHLVSQGGTDAFWIQLDTDGNPLWALQYGGAGEQAITALDVDDGGNLLLAGEFDGTINLGGADLTAQGGEVGSFIARIDASTGHAFSAHCTSPSRLTVWQARFGPNGEAVVVGSFADEMDCGQGVMAGEGGADAFVIAYGPTGEVLWANTYGAARDQEARAIAIDARGHHLITGLMRGAVDFGGGPVEGGGLEDAFLLRLGPTGEHVWSRVWGDSASQRGRAVAVDSAGNILLAGYFEAQLAFGSEQLLSVGDYDVFLAKLAP